MQLKPGCGCLILVLAFANVLVVFSMVYGLVQNTAEASALTVIMVLIFLANVVVCSMLGFTALRSSRFRLPGVAGGAGEREGGEEGTEE